MTSRPRSITTAGRRCRAGAGRSAIAAMMRNRSRRNDESLEQSSASGIVSVMNRIARPLLSDTVPPGLVRMRVIATGLLVLMAALFFVARAFEPAHPGLGYLRSFAEAAMVGGLADWFAVTALFRQIGRAHV